MRVWTTFRSARCLAVISQALEEMVCIRPTNTSRPLSSARDAMSQGVLRPRVSDCYTDHCTLSFTCIPSPSEADMGLD